MLARRAMLDYVADSFLSSEVTQVVAVSPNHVPFLSELGEVGALNVDQNMQT